MLPNDKSAICRSGNACPSETTTIPMEPTVKWKHSMTGAVRHHPVTWDVNRRNDERARVSLKIGKNNQWTVQVMMVVVMMLKVSPLVPLHQNLPKNNKLSPLRLLAQSHRRIQQTPLLPVVSIAHPWNRRVSIETKEESITVGRLLVQEIWWNVLSWRYSCRDNWMYYTRATTTRWWYNSRVLVTSLGNAKIDAGVCWRRPKSVSGQGDIQLQNIHFHLCANGVQRTARLGAFYQ